MDGSFVLCLAIVCSSFKVVVSGGLFGLREPLTLAAQYRRVDFADYSIAEQVSKLMLAGWIFPRKELVYSEFQRSIARTDPRGNDLLIVYPDDPSHALAMRDLGEYVEEYKALDHMVRFTETVVSDCGFLAHACYNSVARRIGLVVYRRFQQSWCCGHCSCTTIRATKGTHSRCSRGTNSWEHLSLCSHPCW